MEWAFAGPGEFVAIATSCLMEGAAQRERLMYVAERPDPSELAGLSSVASDEDLRIVPVADVYGTSGVVDPAAQLDYYEAEVDAALADGYSGLRVVCDGTPLIAGSDALAAMLRWELLADRLMAVRPMTALCAFDLQRVDRDSLEQLAAMHPLSSASGPVPPFRLSFSGDTLRLTGMVDAASVRSLRHALGGLPDGTPAAVDLGTQAPVSADVAAMLDELAGEGTPVTVHGAAAALEAFKATALNASAKLDLLEY